MMLTGDNGILQRAGEAKDTTEYKQIEERIKLAYLATLSGNSGKFNMDIFIGELNNEFGEGKYTLADDNSTITINNREYNVQEYTGQIKLEGYYKMWVNFPAGLDMGG